jgi:hypothetical protein
LVIGTYKRQFLCGHPLNKVDYLAMDLKKTIHSKIKIVKQQWGRGGVSYWIVDQRRP